MNIITRAGLLYCLTIDKLEKINSYTMKDLLYSNNVLKEIEVASIYMFIKKHYDPAMVKPLDYDVSAELFGRYKDIYVEKLLECNFSIEQINQAAFDFMQIRELANVRCELVIDSWKRDLQKKGICYEKKAKYRLEEFGFIIDDIKSDRIKLDVNLEKLEYIELNGRPDGIIRHSPGNLYKKDTILEIKYTRNSGMNNNIRKDELQICAYGIIFKKDVLYVRIFENEDMECKLYTLDALNSIWESNKNLIIQNCAELFDLVNGFRNDDVALQQIIDIAREKY
jgi:hypothetical protein